MTLCQVLYEAYCETLLSRYGVYGYSDLWYGIGPYAIPYALSGARIGKKVPGSCEFADRQTGAMVSESFQPYFVLYCAKATYLKILAAFMTDPVCRG
jgi:hypothetical protein